MKHVVFARDRRKKKYRIKAVLLLMAIISVFIGIVLTLKNQESSKKVERNIVAIETKDSQETQTIELSLSNTQVNNKTEALSISQEKIIDSQPDEVSIQATENLEQASPNNDKPIIKDNKDAASTLEEIAHLSIMSADELDYIDIQDGELDEPESKETIDETATSYEDDFVAEDDIDDEAIMRLQDEAAKKQKEQENKLSPEAEKALDNFLDVADQAMRIQNQFSYTVAKGDKLKDVLEQSGLGGATARVLEKKFPQLANLTTGQQFYWILSKDGELEYMNWLVSEKEEKIFERKSKNQFSVKTIQKKGVWQQDVVKGTLNGDFSSSLKAVGLSSRQINQLAAGIQWQISTSKLKKGDKFVILVRREYINGKVTELGNVEAIHILSGNKSYYAIQADNGRYYSRHGETLGKGFARYPLQFTPRISSQFNPRRLHPVTRRVAPHKGVDFGVPIGTPIIAPSDAVVAHVAYQANGAGRYIKLRHAGQYMTVYMHLSKVLVKVGQSIKKGERIALSGNTGRSTGPHLHYEFHINGNPVNPMTVKLPGTGSSMLEKERKAFLTKARAIEAKLKL